MKRTILLSFAFLSLTVGSAWPATRLVPSQYATIQDAINACVHGDTVIVAPGTYTGPGNRNIDFLGKAITVRSTDPNDPNIVAATIIDCNRSGRGFYFRNNEGKHSILAGLTVTNGYMHGGGGIYCYDSSPTITNCAITHNEAGYFGGGIHCYYNRLSKPSIIKCIITENKAVIGGGLAFCNGLISECLISENQAAEGGGLTGCGGTIRDCVINANIADVWGGGLQHCDGQIANCIVSGNIGGGFFACNGTIRNCTVVGNTYDGFSACWQGPITNCIIRNNSRSEIEHYKITASYSNIKGGWPGSGNIDADPCFVGPGYWDANGTPDEPADDFWIEGDYHLLPGSPCINTGDPNYIPQPQETDLDGNPRIIGSRIDMGAYEFSYIEGHLRLTPRALNPCSKGKWVKAHLVLPGGLTIEDVNSNTPAVISPFGIESEYIDVFTNEDGLVEIEIAFDRAAFCGVAADDGLTEMTVVGLLTSGQYFGGTDTIHILATNLGCLSAFASRWLQTDCGSPGWCDGLDLDRDSIVNFVDFAAFNDPSY